MRDRLFSVRLNILTGSLSRFALLSNFQVTPNISPLDQISVHFTLASVGHFIFAQ
jgi:hypothetical protein